MIKVISSLRGIIQRMQDIYRVWRFLRIIRHHVFIRDIKEKYPVKDENDFKDIILVYALSRKRTILGREYGSAAAAQIYMTAQALGYVFEETDKNRRYMKVDTKAVVGHSTHTALINDLATSVASIPGILTIIISVIALYFSLRHK